MRLPSLSTHSSQSRSSCVRHPHQKHRLGSLSYLKGTHISFPLSSKTTFPLHSGWEISMVTRTQEVNSLCFCFICSDIHHPNRFTQLFRYLPCPKSNCTQNITLLNSISPKSVSFPYRCNTIRRLSKLQGSAAMTFSISFLSSNVNKTVWLLSFLILKPFFNLQMGVKVLAIASTLRARLVKNLVAIINSVFA